MSGLIDRLMHWFNGGRRPMLALSLSAAAVLSREIASAQDVEYDCSEVYRLLDRFAEAVLRGEEIAPWMPLIRAHLERCPDCRAEFEALTQALRSHST